MSQTEGQQTPAQAAAPNGQAKSKAPKLAPAPVPQQTPWKAPVIDASTAKANFEAVDAAQHQRRSKNVAAQRAREANKEVATAAPAAVQASISPSSSNGVPKRATTGKEKWVPYTPVIPVSSSSSPSSSSGSSSRNRQNKRQSASYRQRRSGNGSQGERGNGSGNNNGEKRKSGSSGNQQSSSVRGSGAGHQRAQSRANNKSDRASSAENSNASANASSSGSGSGSSAASQEPPVAGVEKLLVSEDKAAATAGSNFSDSSVQQETDGNTAASSSSSTNSQNSTRPMQDRRSNFKQGYVPRNQNGPRKPRDPRFGGHNAMPYYQGGYIPGANSGMQMGYYPMQTIPMSAGGMPMMYPAVQTTSEMLMPYLIGQVDYYFSVENLCKDTFLRKNMNNEGLVPIQVIADFARVKSFTTELTLVADACAQAPNIEVVGSKVRAAKDHNLWVFPEADRLPTGLDNGIESALANKIVPSSSPKVHTDSQFQVDQAVPFVPKSVKEESQ